MYDDDDETSLVAVLDRGVEEDEARERANEPEEPPIVELAGLGHKTITLFGEGPFFGACARRSSADARLQAAWRSSLTT
jgi:hypothetical protein